MIDFFLVKMILKKIYLINSSKLNSKYGIKNKIIVHIEKINDKIILKHILYIIKIFIL